MCVGFVRRPTQDHSGEGGCVLPLVHSFSPASSLHMGRSVGSPLGKHVLPKPKNVLARESGQQPVNEHWKGERFLLVCVSCHRVPSLVLIHVHTPDVRLLVSLSSFSWGDTCTELWWRHGISFTFICLHVYTTGKDGRFENHAQATAHGTTSKKKVQLWVN